MADALGYIRVSSDDQADSALGLEAQRQRIADYCRSAIDVKRSRGERISRHAPYGWDFGSGGLLIQNRREQRIIARMCQLRTEGMSFRGIATCLDREGIRSKRGQRGAHTTVKSILRRNAA
jgi:DNA invertase Pin-like site-specific DNA recombinase